jgi:hypothetical protein
MKMMLLPSARRCHKNFQSPAKLSQRQDDFVRANACDFLRDIVARHAMAIAVIVGHESLLFARHE